MTKPTYSEKLKDPRWQRMRLEVLQRDEWTCQFCGDKETTLHVHHRYYVAGADPWECPADALVTLCESCHQEEQECRPSHEAALLHLLRKRLLYGDLYALHQLLDRMPPEVLVSLARSTWLHGDAYSEVIAWLRLEQERFAEDRARFNRIDPET